LDLPFWASLSCRPFLRRNRTLVFMMIKRTHDFLACEQKLFCWD
jgi:hypothetical protein